MLNHNIQSFRLSLTIIFVLWFFYLGQSQYEDLQVLIQNTPSFYGDDCQTTFSLISQKFDRSIPCSLSIFSITIIDTKYGVRFKQMYQTPFIHNYDKNINSDVYRCNIEENFNTSYYCFALNSSSEQPSTRLKYNQTHQMYKFTLNNLICPNQNKQPDQQSQVSLKIEVIANKKLNKIIRSTTCNYTFRKLYNKQFFYLYIIGIFVIVVCLFIFVQGINYFFKWIYFLLVVSEIFIKIVFIFVILMVVPEQKVTISYNTLVSYMLINFLLFKNFVINLIIVTNFVRSMIKQKKLMKNRSKIKFALAMIFNYKLYFVVIYRFEPFSSFRPSRFTINHLQTKYYKILMLEIFTIFIQIFFLSTLWFNSIAKLVYIIWLTLYTFMLAIVSKSIRKMLGRQEQLRQKYKRRSSIYSLYEQKQLQLQKNIDIKSMPDNKQPKKQQQGNICIQDIILKSQLPIPLKNNGVLDQQTPDMPQYVESERAVSYSLKQYFEF